jgi:hypothetical protein
MTLIAKTMSLMMQILSPCFAYAFACPSFPRKTGLVDLIGHLLLVPAPMCRVDTRCILAWKSYPCCGCAEFDAMLLTRHPRPPEVIKSREEEKKEEKKERKK